MINQDEWESIYAAIQKQVAAATNFFTQVEVTQTDETKQFIYAREFGDTPIPLVGFRYNIAIYDTTASGVVKKEIVVEPQIPKVGDLVLIARNMGSRRMPRCLGVIFGREYIEQGLGQ